MATTFPWRLVTVDIDGTLTRVHGWRAIARAFGREPDYAESNRRFFAREIGEDEHLADLLRVAEGRTVPEVETVLAATPKLEGIAVGISELRRHGARVGLLTHNPGYVVHYYRRTFGFDEGEGVEVPVDGEQRIGRALEVHADKLGGLRRLLKRTAARPAQVVHVGDGWSDAEVFRLVGGGIALNSALDEVNRTADRVVRSSDFRDVVRSLTELRPRE